MSDTDLGAATASALRPVLVQLATKALAIVGAGFVAHGLATSDQVSAAVSPLGQEIAGSALAIVGVGIGAIHTWLLAHAPSIDGAITKGA